MLCWYKMTTLISKSHKDNLKKSQFDMVCPVDVYEDVCITEHFDMLDMWNMHVHHVTCCSGLITWVLEFDHPCLSSKSRWPASQIVCMALPKEPEQTGKFNALWHKVIYISYNIHRTIYYVYSSLVAICHQVFIIFSKPIRKISKYLSYQSAKS